MSNSTPTGEELYDCFTQKNRNLREVYAAYPHISRDAIRSKINRYKRKIGDREPSVSVEVNDVHSDAFRQYCEDNGIPHSQVTAYWDKSTEQYSVLVRPQKPDYEALRDEIIATIKSHAPKYPKLKRAKSKDGHLLIVRLSDLHIGKLSHIEQVGENGNSSVVVERVRTGVQKLLQRASGWDINQILFQTGDDLLNSDNIAGGTTRGTPQDNSEMWYRSFMTAQQLIVEVVEILAGVADVHYQHIVGNHDELSSFYLSQSIAAWFRDCQHVTFDVTPAYRKFYRYGDNLVASLHGHGKLRGDRLALSIAHEAASMWGETKRRYAYTGHVHSKIASDHAGLTIESVLSPSPTDAWHSLNGYSSAAGLNAYVHHPSDGQVARFTHYC